MPTDQEFSPTPVVPLLVGDVGPIAGTRASPGALPAFLAPAADRERLAREAWRGEPDEPRLATELLALDEHLHDDAFRVFVLASADAVPDDLLAGIGAALARGRGPDSHVLLHVPLDTDWVGDDTALDWLGRDLARVVGLRSTTDLLERLADTARHLPDRPSPPAPPSPAERTAFAHRMLGDWPTGASEEVRLAHAHRVVARCASLDELRRVLDALSSHDPDGFAHVGGAVERALRDERVAPDSLRETFDDRYLHLIYLLGALDINLARRSHRAARDFYRHHASSWVRHERLGVSLDNSTRLVSQFAHQGARVERVLPLSRDALPVHRLDATETVADTAEATPDAAFLELRLARARRRRHRRSGTDPDPAADAERWLNGPLDTSPAEHVGVYRLPGARLCRWPTCVTFGHDEAGSGTGLGYVLTASDYFHHVRAIGRTGFGPLDGTLERAWILPRIGRSNHYHAIADRLPALYGYHLLGLDWPIVSTYELDATELDIVARLGIDPDRIHVDLRGRLRAELALMPEVRTLRPSFFDFCASLAPDEVRPSRRLYVSRDRSPERPLDNEAAVQSLMIDRGFDVVHMEDHDLDGQIRLAASARVIVSPHGAGLANMVFARAGCRVVELAPERYRSLLYRQLAVDCDHRHDILLGTTTERAGDAPDTLRWTIDPARLDALVDEVIRADERDGERRPG